MSALHYLSVCSGIESATVAWHPLGWTPVGFAEIDRFPSRVLAHHYGSNMPGEPLSRNGVPNLGDFTTINTGQLGLVDLLVGGTPCQAFSVAGKRLSLQDARGNLSLAFTVLAHELARSHGLRWVVWENVPGVLSTVDNAFGCFLGSLVGGDDPVEPVAKPSEGRSNTFWRWRKAGIETDGDGNDDTVEAGHVTRWPSVGMVAGPLCRAAWRVLDAQYFGLAQRRRRVFVVAGFGDGPDPAAVLFEPAGVRRDPPARSKAGEGVAATLTRGAESSGRGGYAGRRREDDVNLIATACLNGHSEYGADLPTLRAKGGDAAGGSEALLAYGGNNTSGPIDVATAVNAHGGPNGRQDFESETFVTHALRGEGFDASEDGSGRGTPIVPIAFDCKAGGDTSFSVGALPGALRGAGHGGGHAAIAFDTIPLIGERARNGDEPVPILESGKRTGASSTSLKAGDGIGESGDPMFTLGSDSRHAVATAWAVRRLTPRETEALQGFPDGYTAIPGAADGPRYKTHGNSMAVNVMAWIGRRIAAADGSVETVSLEAAE